MKKCCTVDNLDQATADGSLEATVNVLVCKTCGHQESYVFVQPDSRNALTAYCKFVQTRVQLGLPVFHEDRSKARENPFKSIQNIPVDVAEAVEQLKLAIIRHKAMRFEMFSEQDFIGLFRALVWLTSP